MLCVCFVCALCVLCVCGVCAHRQGDGDYEVFGVEPKHVPDAQILLERGKESCTRAAAMHAEIDSLGKQVVSRRRSHRGEEHACALI